MEFNVNQNLSFKSLKRVKERNVAEAIEKVEIWQKTLVEGVKQRDGTIQKVTLNEAANLVGIPKKTLEDYQQLFKKISLLTDINTFKNQKMGDLRTYLKLNFKRLNKLLKVKQKQQNNQKRQDVQEDSNTNLQTLEYIEKQYEKQNNIENNIVENETDNLLSLYYEDEGYFHNENDEINLCEDSSQHILLRNESSYRQLKKIEIQFYYE